MRFHQIKSQVGLHNMGGSDEGMEMIIAGVIKGLTNEIGLPLTNKALV